jgi:hypothetical protein
MVDRRRFYPLEERDPLDLSTHGLRQLLGWLGILLPLLCVAWAALFPTTVKGPDGEILTVRFTSVSAYYYTSSVWAFVGILVGMGLFLFTYKGYKDNARNWDFWISTLAGVAAIGVAIFPTKPPHELLQPFWWSSWMGRVHVGSALGLFLQFKVFCWVLFPGKDWRVKEEDRKERNWRRLTLSQRVVKYWVYYGCGLVILVCLAWAGVQLHRDRPIFWQEWFALWSFGIAWLRCGQVQWTLRESFVTRPVVVGIEGARAYLRRAFSREESEPPA